MVSNYNRLPDALYGKIDSQLIPMLRLSKQWGPPPSLILMSLSRFLRKIALVKVASTAEEALEAIGEQHYDLCFLDFILPGMTGLDAMKIINE
ncbi:MAG: response regulator, partial [Desulfobulbales bacterium]